MGLKAAGLALPVGTVHGHRVGATGCLCLVGESNILRVQCDVLCGQNTATLSVNLPFELYMLTIGHNARAFGLNVPIFALFFGLINTLRVRIQAHVSLCKDVLVTFGAMFELCATNVISGLAILVKHAGNGLDKGMIGAGLAFFCAWNRLI